MPKDRFYMVAGASIIAQREIFPGPGFPSMWRYCAVISLLGTIAGCVQYHAAPLELGPHADEFAARRLADVPLRDDIIRLMPQAAAWPPREWDRGELLAIALT